MKKLIPFLLLIPTLALADDANLLPPDMVVQLIQFLQSVPYVGPVLVVVLKWIAIIAPIMTALSFFVQTILALPEVIARFNGAHSLAEKIRYWSDKIVYWLSYFSVRNAKK